MQERNLRHTWLIVTLCAAALGLAACGAQPTTGPAVQPTQPPVAELPTGMLTQPAAVAQATQPPSGASFPSERPSALRGRGIFASNCADCHGGAGDGSGMPGAADFTDIEFLSGKSPSDFFRAVQVGVPGTSMPSFAASLSEGQVWDAVLYIRNLTTSPEQLPPGRELYVAYCASCHDEAGGSRILSGGLALSDVQFASGQTHRSLAQSITEGIPGSTMHAFGEQLSQDQVWTLVNYLWVLAYGYEPITASSEVAALPRATEAPPPTATLASSQPDLARGEALWAQRRCSGCRGAAAEGKSGPRLRGTALSPADVVAVVRSGRSRMPSFASDQVSDQDLVDIVAWLKSLAP